jgi:hypothetical protein
VRALASLEGLLERVTNCAKVTSGHPHFQQ